MKIYTKTGDAGETGLFGGPRVAKDHARIEAFGTVDELNSQLGVVRATAEVGDFDPLLRRIQCELLEPLACFILPTGTPLAAALHVCRTVCRRAERRVVTLAGRVETAIPANAIEYLNRLGDLLFVMARGANRRAGLADDPWHPSP
jgi:cob(I)alamin adenosyltransferase